MLFDWICRDNGITHRLTEPSCPTTTGKVERFHGTFRREFLDHTESFESVLAAQAAVDTWVTGYNCDRPHQALNMDYPADRFAPDHNKLVKQLRNCCRCGCLPAWDWPRHQLPALRISQQRHQIRYRP